MAKIVTFWDFLVLLLLCVLGAQAQTTPSSGGSYFVGVNGYNDQVIVHGVLDGDGYTKIVFDLGQAQMSGASYNVYIYANDVCTTAPAHWELYAYSGTSLLPGRTFSGYFTGTPADVTPVTDIDEYNPITAGVSYELSASCHATGNQNFQMGATAGGVFELPTFGEGVATTPVNAVEYTGKPQVCIADSPSACTTSVCEVSGASIDSNNSNKVVSAQKTEETPCLWTFTVTNLQPNLWTNIVETTVGSASATPADPTSALYAQFGVLAPGQSIVYDVQFTAASESVSVFADPTIQTSYHATVMNVFQAIIDGLSIIYPAAKIELGIEDFGQISQALNQMPHLQAAINDLFRPVCFFGAFDCFVAANYIQGIPQLVDFTESSSEKKVLLTLLLSLGVDIGKEKVVDFLGVPGAIASVILELIQNINTAFFSTPAGSVSLTAN